MLRVSLEMSRVLIQVHIIQQAHGATLHVSNQSQSLAFLIVICTLLSLGHLIEDIIIPRRRGLITHSGKPAEFNICNVFGLFLVSSAPAMGTPRR